MMEPIADEVNSANATDKPAQLIVMQEPDQTAPDTSATVEVEVTEDNAVAVDRTADLSVSSQAPNRCKVCDWPLDVSGREVGCTPECCSYRPENPAEQYRLQLRREELAAKGELPTTEQALWDQVAPEDRKV